MDGTEVDFEVARFTGLIEEHHDTGTNMTSTEIADHGESEPDDSTSHTDIHRDTMNTPTFIPNLEHLDNSTIEATSVEELAHSALNTDNIDTANLDAANLDNLLTTEGLGLYDYSAAKFHCVTCGSQFKHESKYLAHLLIHEEKNVYKCPFCDKIFSKSSNLRSHLLIHTGEKPYRCRICRRMFPRMNNLRSHIMRIHKVDRTLADEQIENLHKIDAPNDNPTPAKPPSKSKLIKSTIKVKVSKADPATPKAKIDTEEDSLEVGDVDIEWEDGRKEKSGSKGLPIQSSSIEECDGYLVRTDYYISVPELASFSKGTKRVRYVCKTCMKENRHKSNMVDHVRTHKGTKLYKCKVCAKPLSRKQNLVHHLKYVHYIDGAAMPEFIIQSYVGPNGDENCTTLDQTSDTTDSFKDTDNDKVETEVKIEDKTNEESTESIEQLDEIDDIKQEDDAVKNESYVEKPDGTSAADVPSPFLNIGETFEDLPYEVINADNLEERVFKCKICSFTCDRRHDMVAKHILKHTGQKPFRCVVCAKPYTRKYVLRNHIGKEHKISGIEADKLVNASEVAVSKTRLAAIAEKFVQMVSEGKVEQTDLDSIGQVKGLKRKLYVDDLTEDLTDKIMEKKSKLENTAIPGTSAKLENTLGMDSTDFVAGADGSGYVINEEMEDYMKKVNDIVGNIKEEVNEVTDIKEDTSEVGNIKETIEASNIKQEVDEMKDIKEEISEEADEGTSGELDKAGETGDGEFSFQRMIVNGRVKYKCNVCEFTCTRRHYMATMHKIKHTRAKPYLCVICCKLYSRKYVLRKHLSKEHHIRGIELDNIMLQTGNRLDGMGNNSAVDLKSAMDIVHEPDANILDQGAEMMDEIGKDIEDDVDENSETVDDDVEDLPRGEFSNNEFEEVISFVGQDYNVEDVNKLENGVEDVMDETVEDIAELEGMDVDDNSKTVEGDDQDEISELGDMGNSNIVFDTCGMSDDGEYETSEPNTPVKTMDNKGDENNAKGGNTEDSQDAQEGTSFWEGTPGLVETQSNQEYMDILKSLMDTSTMTCLQCGKHCSSKSNLRQHIKIKHLNLKQFACTECDKTFNTRFNLKTHLRQHMGGNAGKFECKVCLCLFSTKSYLKVHIEKQHGGNTSIDNTSLDNTSMDNSMDNTNMEGQYADNSILDDPTIDEQHADNSTMDSVSTDNTINDEIQP